MTVRSTIKGLLRHTGLAVAWVAVALAGLYVFITSPPGEWLTARIAERQALTRAGIHLSIRDFSTDLFSYIRIKNTSLALPDDTTRVSVRRLLVRYSILDLLRGDVHAVDNVEVTDLAVMFAPGSEDTSAFAWSIEPYLPYVPRRVALTNFRLGIVGDRDTTELGVSTAHLITEVSEDDSSANALLRIAADLPGGSSIGTIPLDLSAGVLLRGPAVYVHSLALAGPGIGVRGSADLADAVNGPYHATLEAFADLSDLPSRASGTALSGTMRAEADVLWSDEPEIDVTVRADSIATPWLTARDVLLTARTNRVHRLVANVSAGLLGGSLGARAELPVAGADQSFSANLSLDSLQFAEIADMPDLYKSMSDMEPAGTVAVNVSVAGDFSEPSPGPIPIRHAGVEITANRLSVNGIDVGTVSLQVQQSGTNVRADLEALGATLTAVGDVFATDSTRTDVSLRVPDVQMTAEALGVTDVSGAFDVDATVYGALDRPSADVTASYRMPRLVGVDLDDILLEARLIEADTLRADLATRDSLIVASALLSQGLSFIDRFALDVRPWSIDRLPGDLDTEYGLAGAFSVSAIGSGPVGNPHVRADIMTTPLTLGGQPFGSFTSTLDYASGSLDVQARNDDRTLEVLGTVIPDASAESQVVVYWNEFRLGAILATLLGQDVSRVAGVSEGSITMTWSDPVAETFSVRARVERVRVRLARTTYELANPPARFEYHGGELTLPEIKLVGDDQSLYVQGSMSRDGDIDFNVRMERVAIGTLVSIAVGEDIDVAGTLGYRLALGGSISKPTAEGFLQANGIQWRSLVVDSVGARVSLDRDTLSVPDLFVQFPFGAISGSLSATLASLGIPVPTKVRPSFNVDLAFDNVGAHVPKWEGLRPGKVALSGAFDLRGRELADIGSYRGSFRVDSLNVLAPHNRSLVLVEPVDVRITRGDGLLSNPARLAQLAEGDTVGMLTISQRADTSSYGLDVRLRELQLAHLRHIVLPVANILDIPLPDDIDGAMDMRASWNMRVDDPLVRARLRIRPFSGYGVQVDSIRARVTADPTALSISEARVFSVGDTLSITGGVGLETDTLGVFVRTKRLELVNVIRALLPPIDELEPPAPWPSTMPIPGSGQHLQRLPGDMSGADANQPLNAFQQLISAGHTPPEDGLAATLPLRANLSYRGPTDAPELGGTVSLLGGYLDLQALAQPIWFTDTLTVRPSNGVIALSDFAVNVGGKGRKVVLRNVAYSLNEGTFDLQVGVERVTFTVISVENVVLPDYLQPFDFLLVPLLNAYYTEPVGSFTTDTELSWYGDADASTLRGDVQLYESVFEYPVPEPQNMIAPSRGGSGAILPGVDMLINVVTRDSLRIENNVTDGATVGFQLEFSGMDEYPNLQGSAEISAGSEFTYLGRSFVIQEATVTFSDPATFTPNVNLKAVSEFYGQSESTPYRVEISVSGTYPDRIKTDMVAYAGSGADEQVIVDEQQIVRLLIFGTSDVGAGAKSAFDDFLTARGYAAVSSAVGSVIPLDQVQIQQRENASSDGSQSDATRVTEIELAEDFRIFGQKVRVSMATPVGRISQLGYQRAEARWYILERPKQWENLESLSLTVGTEVPDQTDVQESNTNENTADIEVRIRF